MAPTVIPDPPVEPSAPPTDPEKKFTQSELDSILEKRLKDERTKLYGDIQAGKEKVSELQGRLREQSESLEALKKKMSPEGTTPQQRVDADKLTAEVEVLRGQLASVEEKVGAAISNALNTQKSEFDAILAKKDIDAFRLTAIAGAGGKIIAEIVTGNTKEEIEASVAKAKARYEEIHNAAAAAKEAELREQFRGNLPTPVTPGVTGDALSDVEGGIDSWRKMPEADWEKKQAEIKAKVFKEVGLPMSTRR